MLQMHLMNGLLVFLCYVRTSSSEEMQPCPGPDKDFCQRRDNLCFKVLDNVHDATWLQAKELCQGIGLTLPIFLSKTDQELYGKFKATLKFKDPFKRFPIGLTQNWGSARKKSHENWVWLDGTPLGNYSKWGANEPDSNADNENDFVYESGHWFDASSHLNYTGQVICQSKCSGSQRCTPGWHEFRNHCYLKRGYPFLKYKEGSHWCHEHGAYPLIINSKKEIKFIYDTYKTSTKASYGNIRAYIDMKKHKGKWTQNDGDIIKFFNLAWDKLQPKGKPSGDGINVEIVLANEYNDKKWGAINDLNGKVHNRSMICEHSMDVKVVETETSEKVIEVPAPVFLLSANTSEQKSMNSANQVKVEPTPEANRSAREKESTINWVPDNETPARNEHGEKEITVTVPSQVTNTNNNSSQIIPEESAGHATQNFRVEDIQNSKIELGRGNEIVNEIKHQIEKNKGNSIDNGSEISTDETDKENLKAKNPKISHKSAGSLSEIPETKENLIENSNAEMAKAIETKHEIELEANNETENRGMPTPKLNAISQIVDSPLDVINNAMGDLNEPTVAMPKNEDNVMNKSIAEMAMGVTMQGIIDLEQEKEKANASQNVSVDDIQNSKAEINRGHEVVNEINHHLGKDKVVEIDSKTNGSQIVKDEKTSNETEHANQIPKISHKSAGSLSEIPDTVENLIENSNAEMAKAIETKHEINSEANNGTEQEINEPKVTNPGNEENIIENNDAEMARAIETKQEIDLEANNETENRGMPTPKLNAISQIVDSPLDVINNAMGDLNEPTVAMPKNEDNVMNKSIAEMAMGVTMQGIIDLEQEKEKANASQNVSVDDIQNSKAEINRGHEVLNEINHHLGKDKVVAIDSKTNGSQIVKDEKTSNETKHANQIPKISHKSAGSLSESPETVENLIENSYAEMSKGIGKKEINLEANKELENRGMPTPNLNVPNQKVDSLLDVLHNTMEESNEPTVAMPENKDEKTSETERANQIPKIHHKSVDYLTKIREKEENPVENSNGKNARVIETKKEIDLETNNEPEYRGMPTVKVNLASQIVDSPLDVINNGLEEITEPGVTMSEKEGDAMNNRNAETDRDQNIFSKAIPYGITKVNEPLMETIGVTINAENTLYTPPIRNSPEEIQRADEIVREINRRAAIEENSVTTPGLTKEKEAIEELKGNLANANENLEEILNATHNVQKRAAKRHSSFERERKASWEINADIVYEALKEKKDNATY